MITLVSLAAVALLYPLPLSSASTFAKRANSSDVLAYVNPLIGSQAGGNVFSGATLPYGMVKGEFEMLLLARERAHVLWEDLCRNGVFSVRDDM